MDLLIPITLSALAMTLIVGGRYLLSSGFFAWLTERVRPGHYAKLKPQISREIRWSLMVGGNLRDSRRHHRLGLAKPGLDTDLRWIRILYPLWYLPAVAFPVPVSCTTLGFTGRTVCSTNLHGSSWHMQCIMIAGRQLPGLQ